MNQNIQHETELRVSLIQTTLDNQVAWNGTPDSNITMDLSEEQRIWREIKKGFNMIKSEPEDKRPHIIIMPELTVPLSKERELQRIAIRLGAIIIAGLDFVETEDRAGVKNKAIVIIPNKWPQLNYNNRATTIHFGKTFFASVEKEYFRVKSKTGIPDPNIYILDAYAYGRIGVAICADFFDIERFAIYKGRIQHLIVIAYNKDIKSFYFLAEAISRLVFCNVIICNTGHYGGSLALSPYKKDFKRCIYKHEGSELFSTQVISLPVKDLIQCQDNRNQLFKSPPDYQLIKTL